MESRWDIDSHEYALGRKFNEMRRSLLWAESEIERLCNNLNIGSDLFSVCRTEYALLRDKLEELHGTIFDFPRIMELTEEVAAIENPTQEQLYTVRMMQIGYDDAALKARAIEKQIDQMTNLLPLSLHAYLYQSNDPEIKLKLKVLQSLMDELLLIFGIEAEIILVGGSRYADFAHGWHGLPEAGYGSMVWGARFVDTDWNVTAGSLRISLSVVLGDVW